MFEWLSKNLGVYTIYQKLKKSLYSTTEIVSILKTFKNNVHTFILELLYF